jgi:DUF4097 and DUF4098 domain-containing protein YvlB
MEVSTGTLITISEELFMRLRMLTVISSSSISAGTVVAHSLNGAIKATLGRADPTKPISFSTLNGEVDVTFPSDFRTNLKIKTDNGDIYSDFNFKLDGSRNKPSLTQSDSGRGNFEIKPDRTIYGTLNGGGQEASFTTFNGRISIRKKK